MLAFTKLTIRIPRLYRPTGQLSNPGSMLRLMPLFDKQPTKQQYELRLVSTLLEMGCMRRLKLPRRMDIMRNTSKVPSHYECLADAFPTSDIDAKVGVSFDETAHKLSEQYLPGIAL